MLRTEITPAGDGPVVQRTIATEPRIEAEGAARQVHGRPQPEAAHELLELFAAIVGRWGIQTIHDDQQAGDTGENADQNSNQDSAS